MTHQETIRDLLVAIRLSEYFHAVIIEGPPGSGKSTTALDAMKAANINPEHLGSYSTPLHFFEFLRAHTDSWILIDDSSGLFLSPVSMAILKAATWPTNENDRVVRWGSTALRDQCNEFVFRGKIVIICNRFPDSDDAKAVKGRALSQAIHMTTDEVKTVLKAASTDRERYANQAIANEVADFLTDRVESLGIDAVNLRTLKKGYELAVLLPQKWRQLLEATLPKSSPQDPKVLLRTLHQKNLPIKQQQEIFERQTGLKRRTFFEKSTGSISII